MLVKVYLCAIRDDMLMQLAKMNPTLPRYRVSSAAVTRNTAENTNIDLLYLMKKHMINTEPIRYSLNLVPRC